MTKKKGTKPAPKKETAKKEDKAKMYPEGWFLMSQREMSIQDLRVVLDEIGTKEYEIWEEAGVIEVILDAKNSIDIEMDDAVMGDEFGDAFLAEHQVKSLFYLSISPEYVDQELSFLKDLARKCDGMLCGDTDDFEPIFK